MSRHRGKMDPDFPGLEWFDQGMVQLRWERGIPRLVLQEQFETRVKWVLRGLTAAGIILSGFTISPWYASVGVSILLLLVGQFFERTIFQYTSIHIVPVPDFKYDPEKIGGWGYAIPVEPDSPAPIAIGPAFTDREFAGRFFKLLRAWNYDAKDDSENNVCLTFVREDDSSYSVIMFANMERKGVREAFERVQREMKPDNPGKEHQQLIMHWVFCKRFNRIGFRGLDLFIERSPAGGRFYLGAFLFREGQPAIPILEEEPLVKFHYRVCNRRDLTEQDIEYWSGGDI